MTAVPAAPRDRPLYGASFGQAVSRFWSKYASFSGRASRSEFWFVVLFCGVINVLLSTLATIAIGGDGYTMDALTGQPVPRLTEFGILINIIAVVWGSATLIPSLAITWRRLHDTDREGVFVFIGVIPIVGAIVVLVFLTLDSNPDGVRFDR